MTFKVLLFGFGPFASYPENPTEIILKKIGKTGIKGTIIHTKILPVAYGEAEKIIVNEINKKNPDLILGTGLAPGRSRISIEKIAINYRFSETPDNRGMKKTGEKIDEKSPDGIFATINVEKLVDLLNEKGIPAEISISAGAYICNETMFLILREANKSGKKAGFIHFPCHYALASEYKQKCPMMDIQTMLKALKLIIKSEIT